MSTVKATNFQHPSATDPAIELTAAGKLWLAGGKILQIVRATDATDRSTTSTSAVDVTGMSVTITPQKDTSAVIIIACFAGQKHTPSGGYLQANFRLTDASNNGVSGAQIVTFGSRDFTYAAAGATVDFSAYQTLIGYATPATTSATTYKLRFSVLVGGTVILMNGSNSTGQMYAIEVSA